jgi:uncharacterized protein YbjT (DUF2867 family)
MVRHERDVARLGKTSASIVIGDFDDADSLAIALKGAAAALTQPGHLGKTYTITGPTAITHTEVAQAISNVIGRELTRAH